MAAKKTAKKKSPKSAKPGAAQAGLDPILAAGLDEALDVGWRNVAMSAVAERAGLPLGEVLVEVPTRAHWLARYFGYLDARMLAGVTAPDPADSVRDRLFEIAMRRFDALNANREAARAVVTGVRFDPPAMAAALCRAERSAAMMLAAAGVSPDGLLGCVRVQGLKAVMLCALKAWIDDDSPDLAKTMAALDRALARAERAASFRGFRPRGPAADAA